MLVHLITSNTNNNINNISEIQPALQIEHEEEPSLLTYPEGQARQLGVEMEGA